MVRLQSGVQYRKIKAGPGKSFPKRSAKCLLNYTSTTPTLTPEARGLKETEWEAFDKGQKMFDCRKTPIKGWWEVLQRMVAGDEWEVYVPAELGFDKDSSHDRVDAGDPLIFRLTLMEIHGPQKRAHACNIYTKKHCNQREIKELKTFGPKDPDELELILHDINMKLDDENILKEGQRQALYWMRPMLKKILQARKNGDVIWDPEKEHVPLEPGEKDPREEQEAQEEGEEEKGKAAEL